MPNTQSPITTSYRICKSVNKEHLNGVITLVDFGNKKGMAFVYVSELRPKIQNPVWHVSAEFIEYDETTEDWKTCFPHKRFNGNEQMWYFSEISKREEGPPMNPSDGLGDNGKNYTKYIKYDFVDKGDTPWEQRVHSVQGNGTGTGGNGEIGE
ncbi:MAG: hypothetical protein ACK5L8_00710 [Marinicella pacifica]